MVFADRDQAGEELADRLEKYKNQAVVVYALPRGGVATALPIAKKLKAPLDLIIVRKIGHPYQKEYAIAAVAENGHMVANEMQVMEVDKGWFKKEIANGKAEAKRRRQLYLRGRKQLSAKGKIAILVDDGIATGLTMEVGVKELKHQNPKKIVVAVPVAPPETAERLGKEVDEFVALEVPRYFLGAVGSYYENFPQVSDDEVIKIMKEVRE